MFLTLSCTSQSAIYNESSQPEILPEKYPSEFYPAAQLRLGHTGKVIVEYSVSATGKPESVHSTSETEAGLVAAATDMVHSFQFSVPHNWIATAGPLRHFQIQIIFNIDGLPKVEETPDITSIIVTARNISERR